MATYQYNLMAIEDAFVVSTDPNTNNHNVTSVSVRTDSVGTGKYYVRFGEIPESYHKYKLVNAMPRIYCSGKSREDSGSIYPWFYLGALGNENFDLSTIVYSDVHGYYDDFYWIDYDNVTVGAYIGSKTTNLANIVRIWKGSAGESLKFDIQGVSGENKPLLLLTFQDATNTIKQTPSSGFVDEKKANILIWQIMTDAYGGASAFTQASAVVSWRNGSEGTVNTIDITGATTECTIPANTFPAASAELQWKVDITLDDSTVVSGNWATLTTIDSLSACSLVSPVSVFVDGDAANRFEWLHEIDTGSEQSAYDLQYSTDNGATWTDIASAAASENEYADIPAGTFPAGTLLWRARTYNTDSVAGSWSSMATIVVQAAPAAPSIMSVSASPRPAITWQAIGQQAYQVQAGYYDSGEVYGTVKTYKVPEYLPDGTATVRVRVKNSFGLWSPWAEADIVIAHTGVADIELRATHDNSEIYLDWTGAHDIYYIYRDGTLIAKTSDRQYADRLTLGEHAYTVRGAVGDAYDLSDTVTATAVCKNAMMADVDNIAWVYCRCRRNTKPSTSASISQQVTYQHYAGRALPVADVAEYVDEAYTFDYSFLSTTEAAKARELLGKVVVFKTPRGECIIGVLESTPYERDRWSTDFTFTVRAVDYQPGVTYDV